MTDAYVTLVTSDNYVSGAVTLAHSLRLSGTNKKIVCMVTPEVSPGSKDYLLDPGHLYDDLITVEPFNSFDTANLSLLGRPELGVTLTKIHVWKLLQYRYVVFIDADAMVLRNIDELFERLERADTMVNSEVFAAAPDTGWPDNFNSGLFACKPSAETYSNLKALALSAGSFDGADQGLLNRYFKNWSNTSYGRLSFTFNVTPSAYYSYAPAYAEYMSNIKVVHFIGPEKPWNWDLRFADGKIMPRGFTSHQFKELAMEWWNIRDDFDTFKRNGYQRIEYVPPTPPPEPPQWQEEYHEEYHEPPHEEYYEPPHEEYYEPPQEDYQQPREEEYHEPPHEEYHEPPPPQPQPWETWSTWHPTDNAWQAPQPANDYYNHPVEDFSQSQYYPNFEVVTPPENEAPKEEPFTFVDCPKPPHIHDIMEAYDNKQNEPECEPREANVDEDDKHEDNFYYNPAPVDDFSHYKVGWNFGELSGFKPHRERMTEEEKENNRLFMNLPGIRVNALYDTTSFREPENFIPDTEYSYKYDPNYNGTFAEYGKATEKPTYEYVSDYGSENQSFVNEPETQESNIDLDNYDLYGFSYLHDLRKKKNESDGVSITSETSSGHRRMSRRRSIASTISMDFEDYQYNKNTFGINDDDPYNYNGVIDDNFHDDLFEDIDVPIPKEENIYDGMYMDQQEPYTDENASYNESDLKNEGYFPEEFDELEKGKVTDTINITQVTNEIALPENKETVVVSDTYITEQKKQPEKVEAGPKEASVPEKVEAGPKEASVPEKVEAEPKEVSVPEKVETEPKEASAPEKVEAEPKEAVAHEPVPKKKEIAAVITKAEPVVKRKKSARKLTITKKVEGKSKSNATTPRAEKFEFTFNEVTPSEPEKVSVEPKEAAAPAPATTQAPAPSSSKKTIKKVIKNAVPKEQETETVVVEEVEEIEVDPVTGKQTVVSKKVKGDAPKEGDYEIEEIEEIHEIIIDPVTGKRTTVSKQVKGGAIPKAEKVEAQPREAAAPAASSAKKTSSSTTTTTTTKKVIKKTVPKKQEAETETVVVEEVEEIEVDPVTGKQTVVSRKVKGDAPKEGDYEIEEIEEIHEVIIDPVTGKRTTVSKQVKGGAKPKAEKVETKKRETIATTVVEPKKISSSSKSQAKKSSAKKVIKKSGSKEPVVETVVVEEVEEIEIDPVTGKETVISRRAKGDGPDDGHYDEIEEVEEIEEVVIDESTGKRTVVSKQVKGKTEKKPSGQKVEAKPREVEITKKGIITPKSVSSSKKTSTAKKVIKKSASKEIEPETVVVEEVQEIVVDPVTGKKTVVSRKVKGDVPKDGHYDEIEEVEEIHEIEVDPVTGKQKTISKQVKGGNKTTTTTTTTTTSKSNAAAPAKTTVVKKEVKSKEVPSNATVVKKEVKEAAPKAVEVKKVTAKPASTIKVSSTKKVVPEVKDNSASSSCKVKVIKKVIRKSPSGKVLEVKSLPEDTSVSNTKVTRTIVIKNKNGDVVDTKTIEGSVDDIESQTSTLIGSGLVNMSDDSNHLSTKIRRTIIRKNADGEILSTEVKNINDEQSLDKLKPISLLSLNKDNSSSNTKINKQ